MPALVRPEAQALLATAIGADDRVLVTGATGWFGTTALALLAGLPSDRLYLVASRARDVVVDGRTLAVHAWEDGEVDAFAATVVLNFAFLTRGKEAMLGEAEYRSTNVELGRRLHHAARRPGVRAVLTCSSGAALITPEGADAPIGTYGRMKLDEEALAAGLVADGRSVVVARAWSVSGAGVQRPHDYAFSDLVLQARTGRITVSAPTQVWRRYCGVDDYLAVCAARALAGWSGTIDSGGPEIEMRGLAALVADRFPGPRPEVVAAAPIGNPLRYASDDVSWQAACAWVGLVPASLEQQVDAVQAALR